MPTDPEIQLRQTGAVIDPADMEETMEEVDDGQYRISGFPGTETTDAGSREAQSVSGVETSEDFLTWLEGSFPERNSFETLIQEETFELASAILAHPSEMPSQAELAYVRDVSQGAIYNQLQRLKDAGLVRPVERESGASQRNHPQTFYTLTDNAYNLVDTHDLPFDDHIREKTEMYEHPNLPEKIERYQNTPRPGDGESFPERLDVMYETLRDDLSAFATNIAVDDGLSLQIDVETGDDHESYRVDGHSDGAAVTDEHLNTYTQAVKGYVDDFLSAYEIDDKLQIQVNVDSGSDQDLLTYTVPAQL